MKILQKVYATQDDSGHWYVIPAESADEFYKDLDNEDFIDSGGFYEKWGGQYMTGGELNLIQLYAEI